MGFLLCGFSGFLSIRFAQIQDRKWLV